MNLNEYGAACRCLLRLRENEGQPGMTDAAFINRFLPRYPEWQQRPGATDMVALVEIARELGVAEHLDVFRDYEQLLREHRAGRSILVFTERAPEQLATALVTRRYAALLVEMDADTFTLWCPYPSGQSENLPPAARAWWDRWLAIGIVLSSTLPAT
jgi:hypothetical protein